MLVLLISVTSYYWIIWDASSTSYIIYIYYIIYACNVDRNVSAWIRAILQHTRTFSKRNQSHSSKHRDVFRKVRGERDEQCPENKYGLEWIVIPADIWTSGGRWTHSLRVHHSGRAMPFVVPRTLFPPPGRGRSDSVQNMSGTSETPTEGNTDSNTPYCTNPFYCVYIWRKKIIQYAV